MLFSICAIISFGLSDNAFIAVPQSQQGRGASRGSRVAEPAGAAGARSQQCRGACRVAEPAGPRSHAVGPRSHGGSRGAEPRRQQGRGATGAVGARSHGALAFLLFSATLIKEINKIFKDT